MGSCARPRRRLSARALPTCLLTRRERPPSGRRGTIAPARSPGTESSPRSPPARRDARNRPSPDIVAAPDSVSILIPAYNEGPVVGDVIGALRAAAAWHEIILVDDGSSDGTAAVAEAAGA